MDYKQIAEDYRAQLRKAEDKIWELQSTLAAAAQRQGASTQTSAAIDPQRSACEEDHKAMTTGISELEDEVRAKDQETADANEWYEDFETKTGIHVLHAAKEIGRLRKVLGERDGEVAALTSRGDEYLRERLRVTEDQVKAKEEQIKNHKKEIKKEEKKVEQLENKLDKAQEKVRTLDANLKRERLPHGTQTTPLSAKSLSSSLATSPATPGSKSFAGGCMDEDQDNDEGAIKGEQTTPRLPIPSLKRAIGGGKKIS